MREVVIPKWNPILGEFAIFEKLSNSFNKSSKVLSRAFNATLMSGGNGAASAAAAAAHLNGENVKIESSHSGLPSDSQFQFQDIFTIDAARAVNSYSLRWKLHRKFPFPFSNIQLIAPCEWRSNCCLIHCRRKMQFGLRVYSQRKAMHLSN